MIADSAAWTAKVSWGTWTTCYTRRSGTRTAAYAPIPDTATRFRALAIVERLLHVSGQFGLARSDAIAREDATERAEREISADAQRLIEERADSALQTARAWGYKEHAMTLWAYRSRAWARKAWLAWYRSAIRCRLEPVKRVARMIKRHLDGIVTAVVDKVTNARAESINAGIQKVKYSARGFRNRKRFRNAIYFHLGGLDLYPAGVTR